MECSSKENISQEMTGRKRGENELIPFTYKNLSKTGYFIFRRKKTILLTYSFA
ncbi:hypothetical protein CHCC20348_1125 [Bacillus paralicheniformis]|nr:hypothetical protein CHCC20348_1125 [Bacillus paralicheniformis]